METSKVVPPPLGEPPLPSRSSSLLRHGGLRVAGTPGANPRASCKGGEKKKRNPQPLNPRSIRSAETG